MVLSVLDQFRFSNNFMNKKLETGFLTGKSLQK
jgi:hypothetical protein